MTNKAFTILSVALLLLCGCASSGRKLDPAKVSQIQKGMTREKVVELLGSPEQITRSGSGETIFNYMHVFASAKAENFIPIAGAFMGGANVKNQMLMITFGPDGLVKDFVSSYGANETGIGPSSSSGVKLDDVEAQKRSK